MKNEPKFLSPEVQQHQSRNTAEEKANNIVQMSNPLTYLQGTYRLTQAHANKIGHQRTASCTATFQRQGDPMKNEKFSGFDLGPHLLSIPTNIDGKTLQSCGVYSSPNSQTLRQTVGDVSEDKNKRNPPRSSSTLPLIGFTELVGDSGSLKCSTSDTCAIVEWPVPVPFTPAVASRFVTSTLDTLSIFKYRMNYPHLMKWMFMILNEDGAKNVAQCRSESLPKDVDDFIEHVLSKRSTGDGLSRANPRPSLSSQLWKKRYYTLLNAVDFACKDNRILTHVCKQSLFNWVSNLPVMWQGSMVRKVPMSSTQHEGDSSRSLAIGSNPVAHLFDRITQSLISVNKNNHTWPCMFTVSVGFLSDVSAQSRILRSELDRRQLLVSRMLHVLKQAKHQKAKLKAHHTRQRELCKTLTTNLTLLRQRLYTTSPVLDQPSCIDDNLAEQVDSPLVVDLESPEKGKVASSENQQPINLGEVAKIFQDGALDFVKHLVELRKQVAIYEKVLREEETRRKRLHNRLQELTGNIRVFCRLRPRDPQQIDGQKTDDYLRVSSNDKLLFCPDTLKGQVSVHNRSITTTINTVRGSVWGVETGLPCPPKCFIFDHVFGPNSTQEEVYSEVDDLVISCIDGYNVCIMAYGQTGSGKTYTMMGSPENPGVNRRVFRSLFDRCNKRKCWNYTVMVSIVEIYQEEVYDLLEEMGLDGSTKKNSPTTMEQTAGISVSSKNKRLTVPWNAFSSRSTPSSLALTSARCLRRRGSVRIMSDSLDGVVLQNLTERQVNNEQEMLDFLGKAENQRHNGATKLNICSSRSHLVILLKVTGENQVLMSTSRGTLTLADLAGSENVTKSGSTGERFLEASCINKSLSSLGRVFDAIRRQEKPTYRETKLTYLLRPTLSGDSKCLLFVALRTEPEHAEETWRAINFGQGAIQVIPEGFDTRCAKTDAPDDSANVDGIKKSGPPLFRCMPPKFGNTETERTSCTLQKPKSTNQEVVKRFWIQ